MEEKYIKIIMDSLLKKIGVLDSIIQKNEEQTNILKEEETDWDAFDRTVDDKATMIDQMEELDKGFDELFAKVKSVLETPTGKKRFAIQIREMQNMIRQITEKSVSIQAAEVRNKQLVEQCFSRSHQKIGQSRSSGRVAMDYYKNMQQTHVVTPAFLDSKK